MLIRWVIASALSLLVGAVVAFVLDQTVDGVPITRLLRTRWLRPDRAWLYTALIVGALVAGLFLGVLPPHGRPILRVAAPDAMDAANWILYLAFFEILIAACATSVLYDTWVPLVLMRPGIGLGIVANVLIPGFGAHLMPTLPAVVDRSLASIAGAVVGYGLFAAIGYLYFRMRKEEGLGKAVAYLGALIGAFGGLGVFLVTLFLSSLLGLAAALPMLQVRSTWQGSDWNRMKEPLPYSLILAVTGVFATYFGEPLIRAYLRLF